MKIFCYVRPWSVAQFRGIATRLAGPSEVVLAGDFPGLGDIGLEEAFAQRYRAASADAVRAGLADLAPDEVEDMRIRCRLLRALEVPQAHRLIAAMWAAINEALDEASPELVLSKAIDSYVLDLLRIAARRRAIPYVGLISLFVNDYYRITGRGEHNPLREPDPAEVERVLDQLLARDYRPDYLVALPSTVDVLRRSLRNQVRNAGRYLYYAGRRRLGGDRLCYHDWSSEVVSRERVAGAIQRLPGRADWQQATSAAGGAPRVFVPLQFFPEATVDYWCPNVEFIRYYDILEQTLGCLEEQGAVIVLKEHPGALGLRPRGFYERLRRYRNVVFVPTAVHSNDVIEACDAVVVWTGTVGFEAALRGKRVMHFGEPFYASGRRFWGVPKPADLAAVLAEMLAGEPGPIERAEQRQLVAHVLSGCLAGVLYDSDEAADVDGAGAANLDRIAAGLAAIDTSVLA